MMTILCAAKSCKYSSNTEDATHVIFINFPNDDTSKIWAHHCGRTDLLLKSNEELHLNYYICSHHIEDRYYVSKTDPIIIERHAVPTLFESDIIMEKDSKSMLQRNEETEMTDSVVLSYCDIDSEIVHYQDISIRLSSLCRICGEPSLDGIEIFAAKGAELKLKEKISLHLPIAIDMEDLMPQKLCTECYNKLEIAHSLVVTSLRTDIRLKRFLNINQEFNYDNRYNEIAKKCSLDVAEEICTNSSVQINKFTGISMNQESMKLRKYNLQESNFVNHVKKEVGSDLNSFIESYDEGGESNNCMNKMTSNNQGNEVVDSTHEIVCSCCKISFRTEKVYENHKALCNQEEIIIQKQPENNSNSSNKESNNMELINFQFTAKPCDVCHKDFKSEKAFIEHRLVCCQFSQEDHYQTSPTLDVNEEQSNPYKDSQKIVPIETNKKKCGHCDSIYSNKKELLSHITECHGGQLLFKCFVCDKSYEKWSGLDIHEATHRIDNPYLCDLCGKSFKHSNNLRGHKRSHLDDSKKKRHVCEICRNAFRSRFHLEEHMNEHKGNKPYACEKCGKAFYKRIQLRQHTLSHSLNKYVCPICGATFNRKGNMNTHFKRHSNGDGIYTCSVCSGRYKSMSELKLHRKEHTELDIIESIKEKCVDGIIWQCKICNRIFSTRAVLMNHERRHNAEKFSIECDICRKKLANKNSLTYHKKSVHSTERPHMCQYCGESFVSKEARLIHERIHTGERPYVCKVCKMEYKCSSNLNQHMKIHSGIKPHECLYCDKSFTRKAALNVHQKIHTGEKPYPCETCGRTFSQKNDMLKHAKTHTAKTMHCEQCDMIFTKRKDILKHMASHDQTKTGAHQRYVEMQQQIQSYDANITCSEFE